MFEFELYPEENIIDANILAKTNAAWNACRINHPWSVGYTSELISVEEFAILDDWVSFYFHSGVVRDFIVADIEDDEEREFMSSIEAVDRQTKRINQLPKSQKSLNYNYGRSWDVVNEKGNFFKAILSKENINLTFRECIQIFLQRVIIDTWNGHARETNTINKLRANHPTVTFVPSDSWEDFNYGIDYKVYEEGELIGAIQIKPTSYLKNTPYLIKAKQANERKYKRFTKRYHAPVWLIASKIDGHITHQEGLLNTLLM